MELLTAAFDHPEDVRYVEGLLFSLERQGRLQLTDFGAALCDAHGRIELIQQRANGPDFQSRTEFWRSLLGLAFLARTAPSALSGRPLHEYARQLGVSAEYAWRLAEVVRPSRTVLLLLTDAGGAQALLSYQLFRENAVWETLGRQPPLVQVREDLRHHLQEHWQDHARDPLQEPAASEAGFDWAPLAPLHPGRIASPSNAQHTAVSPAADAAAPPGFTGGAA